MGTFLLQLKRVHPIKLKLWPIAMRQNYFNLFAFIAKKLPIQCRPVCHHICTAIALLKSIILSSSKLRITMPIYKSNYERAKLLLVMTFHFQLMCFFARKTSILILCPINFCIHVKSLTSFMMSLSLSGKMWHLRWWCVFIALCYWLC